MNQKVAQAILKLFYHLITISQDKIPWIMEIVTIHNSFFSNNSFRITKITPHKMDTSHSQRNQRAAILTKRKKTNKIKYLKGQKVKNHWTEFN